MIPIPYGSDHTATVRGRVPKAVCCDSCSKEYVYFLQRSGTGESFSFLFLDQQGAENQALEEARAHLVNALLKACEAVPCPECGHVQVHMIPRAREVRYRWMGQTAVVLFALAAIAFLPAIIAGGIYTSQGGDGPLVVAVIAWLVLVVGGIAAVGLPVWQYVGSRRYDPNAEDVEVRKQKGRILALTRPEFDQRYPGSEPLPDLRREPPPDGAVIPVTPAT